jgi:hypothetical protein
MAGRFDQAAIEAANRAEVTALLIRCGFRVYRPEADIEGEDLVLRLPDGALGAAQLKPRIYVDRARYGGLGLRMLFPVGPFTPAAPRPWFLVPHDPLFAEVERWHGGTPKWTGRWHAARPSPNLRDFIAQYQIKPAAEPEGVTSGEALG